MTARPRLDAVLFDAGGTLVRLDFEWMSALLAERGLEVPVGRLRHAEVEGRRRYDGSRGGPARPGAPVPPLGSAGDTNAYFGGTLEAAGVPGDRIAELLERFERRHAEVGLWARPAEGAREAIDAVRALGVRAAVVSNSDGRAERHLIDCGVREGLEFVVDSHVVGFEKPDARIFGVALERMGIAAARALYVGDIVAVDVHGARAAGMPVVLLDPHGDYAPPGVPAIPGIAALPEWITRNFATGSTADRDPDATILPSGGTR